MREVIKWKEGWYQQSKIDQSFELSEMVKAPDSSFYIDNFFHGKYEWPTILGKVPIVKLQIVLVLYSSSKHVRK